MAINKNKDGIYKINVYVFKNERLYGSATTLKEAKKIEYELKKVAEDKKSNLSNVSNMRFSIWCDKWLELHENKLSTSTVVLYKIYLNHYKKYFESINQKDIKLKDITDLHIMDFINQKLKEENNVTKEKIKTGTVRKLFFVLSRILKDALKEKNPCKEIEPPEKNKNIPFIPTKEEYEKIYNAFDSEKDKLIISIAGKCGLRRGEIFALKWNDIDKKNNIIIVNEAKAITSDGTYKYKAPKSSTGIRKVPCPNSILNDLDKYRLNQKIINQHIFTGRPDNFSSRFSAKMKKIGFPEMSFHKLRHYCASWLYEKGIPDHIVAEILGHDIMVLKQIYQHLGVEKKEEIFNKIRMLQDLK